MTAPTWINDLVRDFGRSAGLSDLALADNGAAALAFEGGAVLRLEYAESFLVVAMTVPAANDPASAARLLALAHPAARRDFTIRAGYLASSGRAILAIRLAERDATLPALNAAFAALWALAAELEGSRT